MKKGIAMILAIAAMLCLLGGCAEQEKEIQNILPFGTQFGQSYEDFSKALESHGASVEIDKAQNNDGYFSKGLPMVTFMADAELDITVEEDSTLALRTPTFYFSFNQNKELYEFYCFNTVITKADAVELQELLIEQYVSRFGIEEMQENGNELRWENDAYTVSIVYDGDDLLMLIVHCNAFDLNH